MIERLEGGLVGVAVSSHSFPGMLKSYLEVISAALKRWDELDQEEIARNARISIAERMTR